MIQSVLIEGLVDSCVSNHYGDFSYCMVFEVAFDLTRTPVPLSAKFDNQLNRLLRSLPVGVGSLGFDG